MKITGVGVGRDVVSVIAGACAAAKAEFDYGILGIYPIAIIDGTYIFSVNGI